MTNTQTTFGKYLTHILLYVIFTIAVLSIAPFISSEKINFSHVFNDIFSDQSWSTDTEIFVNIRLPRIILAFCAGAVLALSGNVFQTILRNPLATPYTLGIISGASAGAYLAIAFPVLTFTVGIFSTVQFCSLAGAFITMALIYTLSKRSSGLSINTLLLAGVTIGILCSSLTLLIRYLANPAYLVSMDRWIMGGLGTFGYSSILSILPFVIPAIIIVAAQTIKLNHLAIDTDLATSRGIDVERVRIICFAGCSIATAAIVSICP